MTNDKNLTDTEKIVEIRKACDEAKAACKTDQDGQPMDFTKGMIAAFAKTRRLGAEDLANTILDLIDKHEGDKDDSRS